MDNPSNKIAQIKALKNGKGIQYLINSASEILGNPILMHDVDYKVLAYTENVLTDDPLWNELVATGEHGEESQQLFRNEGFMDTVANIETITLLSSPKIKYDRIFGKIFNKDNIMVACIDIICCNKPFEDGDMEAFDAFRQVIAKEIHKSEYYQAYGKMYKETLIKKLIEGSIGDKTFYSCHVANIYQGFKNHLFLAVADIAHFSADFSKLASFRDSLAKVRPDFKYAIYLNYLIIIISSGDKRLIVERDLPKLSKIFEKHNIYVGISGSFENLYQLPKYYAEALTALIQGLKRNSPQRIFLFDELSL